MFAFLVLLIVLGCAAGITLLLLLSFHAGTRR